MIGYVLRHTCHAIEHCRIQAVLRHTCHCSLILPEKIMNWINLVKLYDAVALTYLDRTFYDMKTQAQKSSVCLHN